MSAARTIVAMIACLTAGGCVGAASTPPQPQARPEPTPQVVRTVADAANRGRLLTATACASCHATGPSGASPMPGAPPMRLIVSRYPLDQLEQAFSEGQVTAHPAMPAYVFRASEIDDLIAYLETLKPAP